MKLFSHAGRHLHTMVGIKRKFGHEKRQEDGPVKLKVQEIKQRGKKQRIENHSIEDNDENPNQLLVTAQDTESDDLDESGGEDGFEGFSASEGEEAESKSSIVKDSKLKGIRTNSASYHQGTKLFSGDQSREAHAKQKALAKERKASKPNADIIQRAKKIWERLRIKSNVPKEERAKLLEELFEIVTGRVHDFVFKHDSVRTIQCALKYSTMAQRVQIAGELKGSYCQLVESRYAKFLVAKLITEGNDEVRDMIIPEFYGHVRRLINHPEASWIVDDIYRGVATPEQKSILLREWYGPDYVIFKNAQSEEKPTGELSLILAAKPEKTKPTMDYLHNLINQIIQKKMTGFTMLHDAMLQYFLNIKPGSPEADAFLKLMIGDKEEEEVDLMRNLAFTKSGSRLVCLALAYGTAKDRKNILRAYKDTIGMLAFDKNGHIVLLTAYDVLDDTREIASRVFSELVLLTKTASRQDQQNKVLALAQHQIGHISLCYPFSGNAKWLVPPPTQERMREIDAIRMRTSKKDPSIRRRELIAALSPPVLATIASHAEALAQSSFGCSLITEALISGVGDKTAAASAVADLASGDPSNEAHISHSPAAGRMLKVLVTGGHFDSEKKEVVRPDPELRFADALYDRIQDWDVQWATGLSSFVVVALLENEQFGQKDRVKRRLKAYKKGLEKAAGNTVSGSMEDNKGDVKGKKTRKADVGRKRNAGAKMLLKMLDE